MMGSNDADTNKGLDRKGYWPGLRNENRMSSDSMYRCGLIADTGIELVQYSSVAPRKPMERRRMDEGCVDTAMIAERWRKYPAHAHAGKVTHSERMVDDSDSEIALDAGVVAESDDPTLFLEAVAVHAAELGGLVDVDGQHQ